MGNFDKMLEEFNSAKAPDRLRYGLKLLAGMTDVEIVYQRLAEHLDRHMRRQGLRLESVKMFAETFDCENKAGVAFDARFKKNKAGASLALFVSDRYEKMLDEAIAERKAMVDLLGAVRRSRTIRTMRSKIDRRLRG